MSVAAANIQVPFWQRLRWRLVVYAIGLAIIPIGLVSFFVFRQSLTHDRQAVFDQLVLEANAKHDAINEWLNSANLLLDSFLLSSSNYEFFLLSSIPKLVGESPDNRVNRLLSSAITFNTQETHLFTELFIYDETGHVLFSSDNSQPGKIVARQPYFQPSLAGNYVQSPYYQVGSSELTMLITRPLVTNDNRVVGAIAGRLSLNTLSQIVARPSVARDSNETLVFSKENNFLITPSRFPGYSETHAYTDTAIESVLSGQDGQAEYIDYRTPGVPVYGVYRWFPDLQIGLVAKVDQAEAIGESIRTLTSSLVLAIGAALVASMLGFLGATAISRPIVALTRTAVRVSQGDLAVRSDVRAANEIGVLSDTFNNMAGQIQDFITSLEDRVSERTRDLQTVADVNAQIATILEVDRLLQDVADLTKERFRLYHAHIYLLDETGKTLVLTAGAGHVGRQMVAEVRTIDMNNPQSIVASAARSRRGVIINDVRKSATFLPHPLLPYTAAELAVPLIARSKLLGVLDVQSDTAGYFSNEVLAVMELLGGQIATALSNASLYEQAERTSRYERAMGNIDRQIQGAVNMDEILQIAVRELGKALRVPYTAIELHVEDGDHDQPVLVSGGEGNERYE